MNTSFKPQNYNSLSPYLMVTDARRLVELLKIIFDAKELRSFEHDNGTLAHTEILIDDSVLMLSESTNDYPAQKTMLHVYVPDVVKTFELAIQNGCKEIEYPTTRENDSDCRGGFEDFAGNYWAISTQK
jgi:PhnB protein